MRATLILAAFLPCVAFAQAPVDPRLTETVNELVRGRDAAVSALMNEAAALRAELAAARRELDAAKKAVEACKPEDKK